MSQKEYEGLSRLGAAAIAARAAVLPMTATSALLGVVLARQTGGGDFDKIGAAGACAGLLLAHSANNMINDWVDARRGLDSDDAFRARYGTHFIVHGHETSSSYARRYLAPTCISSLALGAFLVARAGPTRPEAWKFFGAGVIAAAGYTWPLKPLALGEAAVLAVWGPLMVSGVAYMATGTTSPRIAALATLYALGPTLVIMGKHLDKVDQSLRLGVRTLPAVLGERGARAVSAGLLVGQLVGVGWAGYRRLLSPEATALVLAVAARPALRVLKALSSPRPLVRPASFPHSVWPLFFVRNAFTYTSLVGPAFFVGLLWDTFRGFPFQELD
jgi:1,4-dihydroxy-2-naphthoate octaprenyltransferase